MRLTVKALRIAACRSLTAMLSRNFARRCAQHENLVPTRGRACPRLNVLRNILPPLPIQFTVPGLKQASDLLNLLLLFHCVQTDLACDLSRQIAVGYLPSGTGGKFIDAFTELFEHFNGRAYLGGCGRLHSGY